MLGVVELMVVLASAAVHLDTMPRHLICRRLSQSSITPPARSGLASTSRCARSSGCRGGPPSSAEPEEAQRVRGRRGAGDSRLVVRCGKRCHGPVSHCETHSSPATESELANASLAPRRHAKAESELGANECYVIRRNAQSFRQERAWCCWSPLDAQRSGP